MERFDLGDSTLPIRIFGQDIDLNKPSMKQIFDNESKVKDAGDDPKAIARIMFQFVVDMGMPKEIAEKMSVDHFEKLMEHMRGAKKN